MIWNKPSTPGHLFLEKQRIGLLAENITKTKKRATKNRALLKIITLDFIQTIHKMHGRIVHFEKFNTVMEQLKSHRKPMLHMHT